MTRKILLSGVSAGHGGTGKFFASLIPIAAAEGFEVIQPPPMQFFTPDDWNNLQTIKDADVVILHPQYLGIHIPLVLIANNNRLSIMVLDNGFFCIRSYNYRGQDFQACLDCLGDPSKVHPSCSPEPIPYGKETNIAALKELQKLSDRISFFCQNKQQKKLLKAHYGESVSTTIVGMKTDEFNDDFSLVQLTQKYDIVFHGSPHPAKGIEYALQLALELPEMKFLLPCSHAVLSQYFPGLCPPPNVSLQDLNWSSGLGAYAARARMVLCPSLWSAPIESALLKSLYYNGSVAVVDSEYSFQKEIPDELILRLTPDPSEAGRAIRKFLMYEGDRRQKAREWVKQFLAQVQLEKIFKRISVENGVTRIDTEGDTA